MAKSLFSVLFFSILVLTYGYSSDKIVYGKDDRIEYYEGSEKLKKLADSVGGIFYSNRSIDLGNMIMLNPANMKRKMMLCKSEKFIEQKAPMSCTFFLVGKDKVVTAGHCADTKDACEKMKFSFEYKVKNEGASPKVLVSKSDIYSCKKMIAQKLEVSGPNKGLDYALIQLDREVKGREPLKLRKKTAANSDKKQMTLGQKVVVIGHPSGMPLKIAPGAKVTSKKKLYFSTNLDTFGGNSGSPVFDLKTGIVEGILVRGDQDYAWDPIRKCYAVNKVDDTPVANRDGDRGEDVSSIFQVSDKI